MSASSTQAPADTLACIIDALYRVVAAQIAGGRLAAPLILLICGRLSRMKQRFAALAARVAAGTHVPRRREAAGAARPGKPRDPAKRLPERFGWLVRLAQPTAFGAGHLAILLADPQMLALIEAAPQAGRILRPLCRMLGLPLPAPLCRTPSPRRTQRQLPALDPPRTDPHTPSVADLPTNGGPGPQAPSCAARLRVTGSRSRVPGLARRSPDAAAPPAPPPRLA